MTVPRVIGADHKITLKSGRLVKAVLLNNAATTPPFEETMLEVNRFLQTYSALNRGSGPHASITYGKVQESILTIREFLGLREDHAVLFTQGTTSAINLFARLLRLNRQDIVLTSPIEHTSNNLPWLFNTQARVVEIKAFDDSSFDYDDLEQRAEECGKNLRVISLNGASNTTGCIPDIERISRIARKYEVMLFIDAAQLAPYRRINMADGIDALAFSAHKVYAPFGIGVLALPKALLEACPVDPGGGTVDMVGKWDILWCPSKEMRYQAGTWNAVGIVALAASCRAIMDAPRNIIEANERSLVEYTSLRLQEVDGLMLYVEPWKYIQENRLGVFPFNLEGYHHALLGAILEHEYGIETRAGTICNHRLIRRWFNVDDAGQKEIEKRMASGNRLASYGIVRASLGVHNTEEDIDLLINALSEIRKKGSALKYKAMPEDGLYLPV